MTPEQWANDVDDTSPAGIERVIRLAVEDTRERCAKIAEAVAAKINELPELDGEFSPSEWAAGVALRIAARIREDSMPELEAQRIGEDIPCE